MPLLRAALIATVRAEAIELQELHGPEQVFASRGRRLVGEEARELFHYERREWAEDEHRLVYALGRLGTFGALIGVPTRSGIYYYWEPSTVYIGDETGENPVEVEESDLSSDRVAESRADVFQGAIWRVHACCGFLESQFRDRLKWAYAFSDAPELAEAIERLLEGQFGWDAAERRQAMEDYERASFLTGTVADYERFARQAQDEKEEETGTRQSTHKTSEPACGALRPPQTTFNRMVTRNHEQAINCPQQNSHTIVCMRPHAPVPREHENMRI